MEQYTDTIPAPGLRWMDIGKLGWTAWQALIEEHTDIFSAMELTILNRLSRSYIRVYDMRNKIFMYDSNQKFLSATDCCVFGCALGFAIVRFTDARECSNLTAP